jgi:formate--tetrahydrofolate ligase
MHGGVRVSDVNQPDAHAMCARFSNMEKHLENIAKFEQPCVVAINHFPRTRRRRWNAPEALSGPGAAAVVHRGFAEGGKGCTELAEVVRDLVAAKEPHFKPLYDWDATIEEKIRTVAHEMYGAHAVDYTARAKRDREQSGEARLRQAAHLHREDAAVSCRTTRPCSAGRRTSS